MTARVLTETEAAEIERLFAEGSVGRADQRENLCYSLTVARAALTKLREHHDGQADCSWRAGPNTMCPLVLAAAAALGETS